MGDVGRFWEAAKQKYRENSRFLASKRAKIFARLDDADLELALFDLRTFYKSRKVTQKHFSSFREISSGNTTEISTEKWDFWLT